MYERKEIEISQRYLKEIIDRIEEPIVILGGWAVRFLVNKKYRTVTGREYLGSRDVDLGFEMNKSDLEKTPFARAYRKLIDDLSFRPLSFRLFKEIHAETGEVLDSERAKKLPLYQIFPMYVDLVVDTIPSNFREHFGFTPVDEPLLVYVFAEENNRIERKDLGKIIWIPTPDILLAMKIKSYPQRDKEHKRVKDACDIAALLLFTSLPNTKGWLNKYLKKEKIVRFKEAITQQEIEKVAEIIAIDVDVVESALLKITTG
ncbi:MAG: hypothetical protein U9O96_02655 [Candidatus Thermoplasmatota archaeon]|nr:hypothetical protein [Candidatus Thermoplasmatota archaeon]